MYGILLEYIHDNPDWDGSVPPTYKTPDARALGQWVHRQKSAYHKQTTLKQEFSEKLTAIGLRWTTNG